jgi:EmrB/QacA subfamily drug resistance transporter
MLTASFTTTTQRWVLVAAVLTASMVFIDGTALTVALAALQADLNASGVDLFWINNAYALVLAALLLLGGALGDHFGRKRVYMIGIVLFAGGSLLCGLAPTTTRLILARLVQGLGGALMIPAGLATITDVFEAERSGRAIGTWSAGTVIASAVGPVLGGLLAQAGWWRGVFLMNLPFAIVALVVLQVKVPKHRRADTRQLDYVGAALATVGLAGLNYGLLEAPTLGWLAPVIIGALGGGTAALLVLLIVESLHDEPLIPLDLFRARTLSAASLLTLCFYGALNGILFFLPLNLIQVQGYRAAFAGMAQLPLMILLASLSRWAGGLVDRHGPRLPLTVGPAIAGFGFLLLAVPSITNGPVSFWKNYLPALLLLGLGMGLTVAPLSTTVMRAVPVSKAGVASGVNSTLSRLSSVLAIAILGPIALAVFSHSLAGRTKTIELSANARISLTAEAVKLGDAKAPAGLEPPTANAVRQAIKLAFVDSFRLVACLAAALSWLSAVISAALLRGQSPEERPVQ